MKKLAIFLIAAAVILAVVIVIAIVYLAVPELSPPPAAEPSPAATPVASAPAVSTPEPAATPEPSPTPEPTPDPRSAEGLLALVNPWNPVPEDYEPDLVEMPRYTEYTESGKMVYIDRRCHAALMQMLDDCTNAGFTPYICSAYRTLEYQQELYEDKVQRVMADSYLSREEAETEAAKAVALPGTSEHHLGLAADIVDYDYPKLNYNQEYTGTQQWLMEHCWEYGFILRYSADKSDVTGIIYEPWHYRYVGTEYSLDIRDSGLCLEEYLLREEPVAEEDSPNG